MSDEKENADWRDAKDEASPTFEWRIFRFRRAGDADEVASVCAFIQLRLPTAGAGFVTWKATAQSLQL